MQSIVLLFNGSKKFKIHNIYRPPVRSIPGETRVAQQEWDCLPSGPDHLILGEMNTHDAIWDASTSDEDGAQLAEWAVSNNMVFINNGQSTRLNENTMNVSTPDVTLVHSSRVSCIEWQTLGYMR